MEKYKRADVVGIERENERDENYKSTRNPQIDKSKTRLNYHTMPYEKRYLSFIDERIKQLSPKRKIKDDAVLITSFILGSDKEFFDRIIIGWIANAYQEKYADDIPLVLATTYFNSMACEIDENTVARKLSGIAHVIVCNNEYTRLIKDRAQCKGPFNGAVAIYCKGGKPKQFRKDSVYHGTSLETMIIQEVQKHITAKVDETAPTYESLHTEEVKEQAKQNEAMLNEFFDENETLEDRLKKAKDRIAELSSENLQLKMKYENLQKMVESNNTLIPLLKKANISEFYEGEQHDLVVTILQKALCTSGTEETRRHELLSALLKENAIIGNGEETFEVIKKIFSDGEEMSPQNITELKRIGIEVVSEKNHYKLVYKNSKYWFTVSKTPSDKRGGKNLASDITRRLSVYK